MGYTVLHFDKAIGNDSAMSAHIERTIIPEYVDKNRTHLNKELIKFPNGISNRTQAIQFRIDNANLSRKVSKNQVRAIRILLSGSNVEMNKIFEHNKIDEWSNDTLQWLKDNFGEKNIVSAVIHLDETTPHIHATLVPVVSEERKKKKSELIVKKNYKKKLGNRLSANDIMTRANLKLYQTTYSQAMNKYDLKRGLEGSKAKHTTTAEYYQDLSKKNENLQNENERLINVKYLKSKELEKIQNEITTEKVKEKIVELFTGSKTKKLNYEIEEINQERISEQIKSQQEKHELLIKISDLNSTISSQKSLVSQSLDKVQDFKNAVAKYHNLIQIIDPKIDIKIKILKKLKLHKTSDEDIKTLFENKTVMIKDNKLELIEINDEIQIFLNGKNFDDQLKQFHQRNKGRKI